MLRLSKQKAALVAVLVLVALVAAHAAFGWSVPTWTYNDHATGAVKFFDSVPHDQVSAGPGFIEVEARADTVRVSWHYYTGSAWVAMKSNVAYGDTNYIIPPGGKAFFRFTYPKPDAGYLQGGTAKIWAE